MQEAGWCSPYGQMLRRVAGTLLLFLPAGAWGNAWIDIPAGSFLMGSTPEQIETAYRISARGYGHEGVRRARWFDHETPQRLLWLPAYRIQQTPVTQTEYAEFVHATGHPAPFVDRKTWDSYRLAHPYAHVLPYLWRKGKPPPGKQTHPVVLVSYDDARAYAAWLSSRNGRHYDLPTEAQWEKAMRGTDGRLYPWGDAYDPKRLNNADFGPLGTMPVGSFPEGASPFGVLDAAGQVFEWTRTSWGKGSMVVKGGSWDDHGGICRPAARHGRPLFLKHILIGFRLVEEIR